ncbi:hypothetical protein AGMMS50255_0850 [Spirochaetia bacterium]|nr:hypothetical protein AGMMS50255_0850 [Spirochaetia bacterium]
MPANVPLKWLEPVGAAGIGVTWGVPWKQGELSDVGGLVLRNTGGDAVPMSAWVTGRWPDNTVKWTAHAAVLDGRQGYHIESGTAMAQEGISVNDGPEGITIKTDVLSCAIPKSGPVFIKDLKTPGKDRGLEGRLICNIRPSGTRREGAVETISIESGSTTVVSAAVEQSSFNRLCVRVDGKFSLEDGSVPFLFTTRLYFYLGSADIRFVHTVICDIDQNRQQLAALALDFSLPMTGELYNRHVAFAGDEGIFAEAAQLLLSLKGQGNAFYREQHELRMQKIAGTSEETEWFISKYHKAAVWTNYRLTQIWADSYHISKNTHPECTRLWAVSGNRAKGLIYAASEWGGAAFSIRDFWQKFPMTLEADALDQDTSRVRLWLWSDEAAPYNFSAYDTRGHGLDFAYEGGDLNGSEPRGIANTTELTLRLYDQLPTKDSLWNFALDAQKNALLVCDPERYYETQALGLWPLPDYKNPVAAKIEGVISGLVDFYYGQIEKRRWYGFWNYGDIMHSYDPMRHVWRYDFGGCAWHNTELAPNLWLWHQFLRTGQAKVFEFARIMARHTSEVDCYHFGKWAGLGSRHNVVHWGCSAKEARIMMAFLHRPYYFLTADERIGEIMDLVKDVDRKAFEKDPMGMYFQGQHPGYTHVRSGPDWLAFASNWMSQYERHGNEQYWQKLKIGLKSLEDDELGLLAGPTFLYNPDDGRLIHWSDNNYHYHMVVAFGGSEVLLELQRWLGDDKRLKQMIADFGKGYTMTDEEIRAFSKGRLEDKHEMSAKVYSAQMISFGAKYYQDPKMGAKAWDLILDTIREFCPDGILKPVQVDSLEYPIPEEEIPGLSTNNAAQLPLAYFAARELIPEFMPKSF